MNMNAMMKQAQKLQSDMAALQEELKSREYSASAGGGMVTAVVNGDHQLLSIAIKPDVVDPEDVEMLQDLVLAAVNEAIRPAAETGDAEMKKLTGGMGMF